MNATTVLNSVPSNNAPAVPSVIPRWSHDKGFVLVLADEWNEAEHKVKAYVANSNTIVDISNEEYDITERLSENDTRQVVEKFKKAVNVDNVIVRHRKKYSKNISKVVDRMIEQGSVPPAQLPVLEDMARGKRIPRTYTRKSEAAQKRMIEDAASAAAVSLKAVQGTASEDAKAKAVADLSLKIANLILSAI